MERKGLDAIIKSPDELKQFINEQMREIHNELLENRDADVTVAMVIGDLAFKTRDVVQYFDECNKLFLGLGMAYDFMHDIAGLANVIKDIRIKEIAYNVADKIYNSI